jgi:hypothetical protein
VDGIVGGDYFSLLGSAVLVQLLRVFCMFLSCNWHTLIPYIYGGFIVRSRRHIISYHSRSTLVNL